MKWLPAVQFIFVGMGLSYLAIKVGFGFGFGGLTDFFVVAGTVVLGVVAWVTVAKSRRAVKEDPRWKKICAWATESQKSLSELRALRFDEPEGKAISEKAFQAETSLRVIQALAPCISDMHPSLDSDVQGELEDALSETNRMLELLVTRDFEAFRVGAGDAIRKLESLKQLTYE